MPFYDAILFDFDGVLADSEPIHYDCWIEVLGPYGFKMDWETYAKTCIGISDRKMIEQFAASVTPPLDPNELFAQYPRKKELFRDRMIAANPFPPATLELVRDLARQMPLAVVSSSGRTEVEPPIVAAGIRDCFHTLICGLEAGKLKPAPDPYLKAAALIGSKKPLVVEDSDAGAASGTTAGFEVLRIPNADDLAVLLRAAIES